jgi:hypothetical protein
MKTRFGTVTLIAGHNGKLEIKYFPFIKRNISEVIHTEHKPTQAPGDFLLDISSFRPYSGEFAIMVLHKDCQEMITSVPHEDVVNRLAKWNGIVRIRLGKMLSFRVGGYFVRIWNFLDVGGNTISWNISPLGELIPQNVKRSLMHADHKRNTIKEQTNKSRYSEQSVNTFSLSSAFEKKTEDWSPSQALTTLHVVSDNENVDNQKLKNKHIITHPNQTYKKKA